MKIFAFYLPQYHEIPENNQWWGKGFTEWTNLKKSTPRFKGHNQPRIPLNGEYYNLLEPDVMEQQMMLAQNYGIDGFCFYHYWFDGKLLLEKPLEILLHNKKAELPFCFSWANEAWVRNWNGGNKETLIEQRYGSQKDWANHFDYLIQFFRDDRYIKVDNKPLFIIYKPHLIPDCAKMLDYWSDRAKDAGFAGIEFGYQHHTAFYNKFPTAKFQFGIEFEPWYTIGEMEQDIKSISKFQHIFNQNGLYALSTKIKNRLNKLLFSRPNCYDYADISKRILNRPLQSKIMKGCFPDWDNSPRHLIDTRATIIEGSSPEAFEKLCEGIAANYTNDFLFINAWNEWTEGAYLEPDQKYGFKYLEIIKNTFRK